MKHTVCTVLAASLLLGSCDEDGSKTRGDSARETDGSQSADDGTTGKGTGKVGDPCQVDSDCAEPPSAKCFTTVGGGLAPTIVFPGGYCSRGCGNEDAGTPDCGEGGGCAQLSLGGSGPGTASLRFCAKSCTKNDDCRVSEGYTCRIIFPGFPGVCGP
jgi:hypothetical protein